MGLGETSQQILEKYNPYVRSLAVQVRKQFRMHLELDDLMSYGQVGLLEAAERFDAKVGANFLTFAHYRIKGAIYDGLRKMGILRGGDARQAYQSEREAAYMGNLSDREQGARQLRPTLDDDVRDLASAVAGLAVVLTATSDAADGLGHIDADMPADQRIELEQTRERMKAALSKLPDKERQLLEGYYFKGKTLEEAGSEIGQSKSWASRLHARAIERLKQELENDDEPLALTPSPKTRSEAYARQRDTSDASRPTSRPATQRGSGPQARPK